MFFFYLHFCVSLICLFFCCSVFFMFCFRFSSFPYLFLELWYTSWNVTFYYRRYVLHLSSGIEDVGPIKWDLALCLLFSWIVVVLCLIKGIKTSGKVNTVNTDFTSPSCQNAVANQALHPFRAYPRFPHTHSVLIYSNPLNKSIQFT
jgi:hypothetical protein